MPRVRPSASERFWPKVAVAGPDECWLWIAGTTTSGYGTFSLDGGHIVAHRFAYQELSGPIPEGLQLDHLCRNRRCVNPAHLEPVTHRENCLRGIGIGALNAVKTHCPQGHPYDEANTYRRPGNKRGCRACNTLATKQYQARKRMKGMDRRNQGDRGVTLGELMRQLAALELPDDTPVEFTYETTADDVRSVRFCRTPPMVTLSPYGEPSPQEYEA